jgi:pimeloyl-ACP methyl ester carboxylesterase
MAELELRQAQSTPAPPNEPLRTMWLDLLGSQVHMLGRKYRTRVIESGDGPALLLLHGIGGHAEAFARNVMPLSRGRRVMAIDLLWHGFSSKPPYVDGEDIPSYADQILDLLDSEGIEQVSIEGESLGGWIGLWIALHHPDRLERLVLNTTAGIRWAESSVPERPHEGRELLAQRSLAAITEPTPETIRRRLEWLMARPERVTDELVALRLKLYSDSGVRASLRSVFLNAFAGVGAPRKLIDEADLGRVRAPTLVLWTAHNPGAGPEVGRRIASRIPGARFYIVEDAAHWPQWEQPEEHDRVVAAFLDGQPVGEVVAEPTAVHQG